MKRHCFHSIAFETFVVRNVAGGGDRVTDVALISMA